MGQRPFEGPRQLPLGYAGMEVTVDPFTDSPLATHAVVNVTNYLGYEVQQAREFLFIRSRFVLVGDITTFHEGFHCRIGPVWNTQNVAPALAPNWSNSYLSVAYSLPPAFLGSAAGGRAGRGRRLGGETEGRAVSASPWLLPRSPIGAATDDQDP